MADFVARYDRDGIYAIEVRERGDARTVVENAKQFNEFVEYVRLRNPIGLTFDVVTHDLVVLDINQSRAVDDAAKLELLQQLQQYTPVRDTITVDTALLEANQSATDTGSAPPVGDRVVTGVFDP